MERNYVVFCFEVKLEMKLNSSSSLRNGLSTRSVSVGHFILRSFVASFHFTFGLIGGEHSIRLLLFFQSFV